MTDHAHDLSPPEQTRRELGEFLRGAVGNIILLLLLVGIERLFFAPGFYSSLIQHPFWIVILIAAVHDGLFVGVVVAIAATLLMDWPPRPADADITSHYIEIAVLPLQWLLATLCIGLFRQVELRKARADAVEMKRLETINEVLGSDIVNLEAHMTRAQLESLSRGEAQDRHGNLMSSVLALQEAELGTLASVFDDLAELCVSLPASVLVMNGEGELEALSVEGTEEPVPMGIPVNTELLAALRTPYEVIVDRTAPFDGNPEFEFIVLAGITSPDRRTLHGAVSVLANNRKAAAEAAESVRFLAGLLVPVLTRIRSPKIATSSEPSNFDGKVRKISNG